MFQTARERYKELDDKLFEAYIEEKSNPIVGVIEQNIYRGRFDWKTCRKPVGNALHYIILFELCTSLHVKLHL